MMMFKAFTQSLQVDLGKMILTNKISNGKLQHAIQCAGHHHSVTALEFLKENDHSPIFHLDSHLQGGKASIYYYY